MFVHILIPNALLMAFALITYGGNFIAGRITLAGLLLVFSALLPAAALFIKKGSVFLNAASALLNTCLFLISGYIFCGTVYIQLKHGGNGYTVYAAITVLWLFAALQAAEKKHAPFLYALAAAAVFGLYKFIYGGWTPSMNAAVLAIIMTISFLNLIRGLRYAVKSGSGYGYEK